MLRVANEPDNDVPFVLPHAARKNWRGLVIA